MQGRQQRSLQEAQTEHQIDMERRRQRIALIERLLEGAAGFTQTRVVDGHAHQALRAVLQGTLQDRLKQLLRVPLATRVQKIFGAPTAVLVSGLPVGACFASIGFRWSR